MMRLMKWFAVVVVVEGGKCAIVVVVEGEKCAIVVVVDAAALLVHGSTTVNNQE